MPSGLKEGGHHRKALDVAAKKKAQKKSQKDAQIEAGRSKVILEKILALDSDAEIYLKDPEGRPMCADYFRFDRCSNRRCKFSHDHSIADAVVAGNVASAKSSSSSSSSSSSAKDYKDGGGSMTAVEQIPCLGLRSTRPRGTQTAMAPPTPGAAGAFEAQPEVTIALVASFFNSNVDVANMSRSCRYLRRSLLYSEEVNRRRNLVLDAQLMKRNQRLRQKSTASRLQFAVSYATKNGSKNKPPPKEKKKNGRGRTTTCIRPTLAYDFENPQVFSEFEASYMTSSFASKVQVGP
eukprot:scaffold86752_cov48-Attheya_sp.AAC.3